MTPIAFKSRVSETVLKRTTSRCPHCLVSCPAEVLRTLEQPSRVILRRQCPTHGSISQCIASDARFYWLAKGNPANEGGSNCCGGSACCAADDSPVGSLGRNAQRSDNDTFETLSTCLALIEIVRSCNLACPTCYADSPIGAGSRVDAVPIEELKQRIQGVIDRKGGIEILQLSGGEPTLHPRFFELLEWARDHEGIDYLLLNTNGVRLAHEPAFAARLGKMFQKGGLQLYLQFDGVQAAGQTALRGTDLREIRLRAIEHCGQAQLPITLAMTVTPDNLSHLWEAVAFGLSHPHIHGISFQPVFGSGRIPRQVAAPSPDRPSKAAPDTRLNTADILMAVVEQSGGQLHFDDFTPLPCGDPNCTTLGYLIRHEGQVHSISQFVDFRKLQGFLKDKVQYTIEDLARCGCENEPLGELLKSLEVKSSMTFRLMVKPFMDAWTWDQDRIDRCCTHVIRPDGSLDSFCRYYSGFPDVGTGS